MKFDEMRICAADTLTDIITEGEKSLRRFTGLQVELFRAPRFAGWLERRLNLVRNKIHVKILSLTCY